MTALDRALAKAFRQEAAPLRPAAPPIPAPKLSVFRAEPTAAPPHEHIGVLPTPADLLATVAAAAPLEAMVQPAAPSESVAGDETFRALLEVDRFAWPEVCQQLLLRAAAAFDRFTAELTSRAAEGQKSVALVGCGPKHGATTALCCAARQLAAQGLNCALVDADLRRCELATRLGVAVAAGWDDALSGEVSLGEVVVASLEDRLTLVPRRAPLGDGERPNGSLRAAVTFQLLRDHFDLLLLDGGSTGDDQHVELLAACASLLRLDCVYLVYDRRAGEDTAAQTARRLERAGLNVGGAIENFGAAPNPRPRLTLHRPGE